MKFNGDCFGSGLFGTLMVLMVSGFIWFGCSQTREDGYNDGKRDGSREAEEKLTKKYRDPASYPAGSCVQQAIGCLTKKGEPVLYRSPNYNEYGHPGLVFACEKTEIAP